MAGFLDGRWQPFARLVLNAGFRVEDNASFGTRVVPRAGAALTARYGSGFWGATRVRFSYGQGIKEPRLDQSFGTDPCNPGNPNLRPEQSRTYDAGLEQHLAGDRVRVSADAFYNQFRDITSFTFCFPGGPCPVQAPSGCPFGFGTYFNTDLARARGADLVMEAQPMHWLQVTANYTYDDTRVLAAPNAFDPTEIPGNHLLRRPVNSGTVVLSAVLGRAIGTLTGRFVGERTDSDFLYPPLGLTRDPGFATMDLAASFRISHNASFIGRIDNLFNRHYQEVLGYPALGRGVYAGMRFDLGGE
jgi:vitamin B12 transporter